MAERIITHRKSQTYLNSVLPVTNTQKELVKKKLESGKFPFTATGLIKIVGIFTLLSGLAIFLAKPNCASAPDWYQYLYPISAGIHLVIALTLYFIFSAGLTVARPGTWVNTDIVVNLLLGLLTIISSILTSTACDMQSSIHRVPGPVGIAGGAVLIVSCGSMFLLYRYTEDEVQIVQSAVNRRQSMNA